jgi:hypothetical protein
LKTSGASSGLIDAQRVRKIDKLNKLELRKLLADFANSMEPPRMILFTDK